MRQDIEEFGVNRQEVLIVFSQFTVPVELSISLCEVMCEEKSYLLFTEVGWIGDSSESRAISQHIKKHLPERKQDAVRLSGKEECRIVRATPPLR